MNARVKKWPLLCENSLFIFQLLPHTNVFKPSFFCRVGHTKINTIFRSDATFDITSFSNVFIGSQRTAEMIALNSIFLYKILEVKQSEIF